MEYDNNHVSYVHFSFIDKFILIFSIDPRNFQECSVFHQLFFESRKFEFLLKLQ
jgi:hypothetical protein